MTEAIRPPWETLQSRLGLGVGLDLPWGTSIGFENTKCGGHPTSNVNRFLRRYDDVFNFAFVAFQPKNRGQLRAEAYFPAYKQFFDVAAQGKVRALHQTTLNLGSLEVYDRREIADFTNQLAADLDLRWVVEDIGIWSVSGKVMPYPLPPVLTELGLIRTIENVKDAMEKLTIPLCVEFPGFTDGSNFFIGNMHAYEFFSRLVEATGVSVTLDAGHLISYQWLRGHRGEALFEDLEALPLENCFEIHLSGCSIVNGKFRDAHHGIILNEQIDLLVQLLDKCPNLKAVTYEDPRFDQDGELIPKSVRNFRRLADIVAEWAG